MYVCSNFQWYFSSLGVTEKTFELARSIFSFHVEMFFLLGELKASLVMKRFEPIEWSNQNPQGWNMAF